jgi:hypothetical protein
MYLPAGNRPLQFTNDSPIQTGGNITLSGPESFPTEFVVSNSGVLVSKDIVELTPTNTSTICMDRLETHIMVSLDGERFESGSGNGYNGSPICKPISWFQQLNPGEYRSITNDLTSENTQVDIPPTVIDLDKYIYYPYPFDYFLATFEAKAELSYLDIHNQVIGTQVVSPSMYFTANTYAWNVHAVSKPKWDKFDPLPYFSEGFAIWSRPTLPIVFCILIFTVLFVTPVVIPFLNNRSDIIGTTLAFILGIWVFRQILLPSETLLYGLLDYLFIGGCFLAISSMLLSFFIIPEKINDVEATHNKLDHPIESQKKKPSSGCVPELHSFSRAGAPKKRVRVRR